VYIQDLLKNPKKFIADLATSAWVKQEKFKGRRGILNIADNIGGVSSPYCGWSFSRYWNSLFGFTWKMTPKEAAEKIKTDEDLLKLRSNPFFAVDNQHLWPNPLSLLGPGLEELVSDIGSEFVDTEIRYTGLDNYYTNNNAAHDKVKVKDWLLAEAFPATTLPMGANQNGKLRDNNIDMSGVKDNNGGCCKTSEDSWPRKEDGNLVWFHSDYKDIAYQHVFAFYEKIKELSKNRGL